MNEMKKYGLRPDLAKYQIPKQGSLRILNKLTLMYSQMTP